MFDNYKIPNILIVKDDDHSIAKHITKSTYNLMNIAIFGYGKMGKKISEHALNKGHKILIKSTSKNPANKSDLSNVDVVIDFSTPNSAFENISYAINNKIPVISGTTNWLNKIDQIHKLCNKNNEFKEKKD